MNNKEPFLPSPETLKIREIIKDIAPDTVLTWKDLQAMTGIEMDTKGRNLVRLACKSEAIEYSSLHRIGIVLSGPNTGANIVYSRVHAAKRAIQRSHKSYHNIAEKHLADMPEEDQKRVVMIGAVFAAMEQASNRIKLNKPKQEITAFIPTLTN